LQSSDADPRRASELHTLNLWSHANPDSYSCADADSNTNGYSNSYAYTDSYAYAYGYSDSYAYTHSYAYGYSYSDSDSYCNCYSNGNAYTDTYADGYDPAETKPDTKARSSDTAASPLSGSGKLIVHSAAGVERPRLRAFGHQASSHEGTKFLW
jgi:hypothetical protein